MMHIPLAFYFSDQHTIPALSLFPCVVSHPLLGSWAWWMAPGLQPPLSILTGPVLWALTRKTLLHLCFLASN